MDEASFSSVSLDDPEEGLHCQPCLRDAQTLDAHWFCVDCDDFLCDACHRAHRKIKTLQRHALLDKAQARTRDRLHTADNAQSQNAVASESLISTPSNNEPFVPPVCGQHDSPEDHFCLKCGKLCCVECVGAEHGSCDPQPMVLDENSDEMEKSEQVLQEAIANFTAIRTMMTTTINNIDARHTEVAETVKELIGGFNDLLKYLVGDVVQTVSLINDRNVTNCELTISRAEAAHREILQVQQRLNDDNYSSVADVMKDVETVNNTLQYITCGASEKEAPTSHKSAMAAMNQVSNFMEHVLGFFSTELAPVPAELLDRINFVTGNDEKQPLITGALVTRSRLVVADRANQAVKVYDRMVKGKLIAELRLADLFEFKTKPPEAAVST